MAYAVKYILQFTSDRGNEVRIEVLKKDYQGEVIYKSLGGSPSLSIEQGDGAIKGSSLVFAMQADIEGELQELYTTDNKQFKVNMYRNEVLSWQGYILPELYSEEYVDAPYDVSVTATDQLATLKAITYQRQDVNVSLSTIIEDILSFTQISVPVTYHQNLSALRKGEVPMLVDSHISQAAYNGYSCYDVLNNILLSCNCCIMQINGEWLITSLTNSTTNYYTAGVTQVREHKALGQLGVGEVCPAGTLTMVNNPALKGARVEYAHMLRHSFLVNADCVDREGWNYTPDSRNPIDIPGEREAFGKIFKAYCWELHPVNIRENNSLQLWQEVSLEKDERNYYDLSVKTLFGTNAKLLLMAVTYLGSDGVERRLTSEGWIETWDKSDVNYYIQITGTNKNAGLDAIADIEQYEMSTVQFALPPVDGTMRVGFINSTTDYAEPLASAPIYVSQVYLTVSGVTGQECTTEVEPNATQEQQDVLLAYGDTFESENAYKLGLNTLKKSSGENITSWWLDNVNFSSYYDTMLQEFSRYFGVKKAQLQGIIMGKDVLSDMYADVFSGRVMRLLSAQVDMLADEASVTVEEVITTTVGFDTVIYATNNTNSFGSSSGGGAGTSGGASSTAGESLLGVQSDGDVYVKDGRALVGSEARFEKMALPSSAPDKRAEQKTYIYSSDTSRGAIDIAKIVKYIEEQEKIWVLDSANGVVRTQYNVVSTQEIISGRRASGSSSDVTGGGGISQVTAQMIVDALGYVPYSSQNPSGYITSSALNGYAKTSDIPSLSGYATQSWVEGKKYLTAIPSEYITETELSNTLGGYQTKITSSNKLAYSLISGTPTLATIATSGKYSDLSGLPTIPTNNNQLTNGMGYITSAALNGYATQSWVDSNFLSKSGGTMVSGAGIYSPLDSSYATVAFNSDHNAFGSPNVPTKIRSSSNPVYTNGSVEYSLIHSGNYSSYVLPLSGGTINGMLTVSRDSAVPFYIKNSQVTNSINQATLRFVIGSNYGAGLLGKSADNNLYRTDASLSASYKIVDEGNYANTTDLRYLQLSGGTMSGVITMPVNYQIQWGDSSRMIYGSTDTIKVYAPSGLFINDNLVVHSGNIGSQSVYSATRLQDSNGALVYNSGNTFYVGDSIYSTIPTHILGKSISLRYGASASYGLVLKENGNILVGTTTDSGYKLDVRGGNIATDYGIAGVSGSTYNRWSITHGSNRLYIQSGLTDGSGTSGDVWISGVNTSSLGLLNIIATTTALSGNLTVASGGAFGASVQTILSSATSDAMYYGERTDLGFRIGLGIGTSSNRGIYDTKLGWCFQIDTANRLTIVGHTVSGNLTATGEVISSRRASSSDCRLKDNITYLDITDCLAMIRRIRPAEWDWKDDGKHSMGFIAQDVEHLMPYAVTSIKDDILGQKLNLQYDQFIALAIGGVKAVDNEVERLRARVEYLENKIKECEYGNYRN